MTTATAFRTEQEAFWAGSFGTDYIDRNASEQLLASNLNFFSQCLRVAERPASLDSMLIWRFWGRQRGTQLANNLLNCERSRVGGG